MEHNHRPHCHSGSSSVIAYLAGAATAAALGAYFFYGPNGDRNTRNARAWMLRARADILEKMAEAKDKSEETYQNVVDEVMKGYGAVKEVGKERAGAAARHFKNDWQQMKDSLEEARKEVEEEMSKK